ncbi:MAG: TlyA family RNA methyltransferase [Caulobacterales bacterium]|nr:TlyA family RNA methyltransferase [Caulobacterales bacterium]
MSRRRADLLLVERGLFSSRAQARAAIEAGGVAADGRAVRKPSELIDETAAIDAAPAHPWVSRAGVKLAHALDQFQVDPAGRPCLDVGASTGGFTEVLLAAGARHVIAVDVGRDQLHPRLRADARVTSLEGRDARDLAAGDAPEPASLVTCDASFIGLAKVLPAALGLAAPQADLIALFKPQFEVGPEGVGKGGVVRDAARAAAALDTVSRWLTAAGWPIVATTGSPIPGADGNQETLIWARRQSSISHSP